MNPVYPRRATDIPEWFEYSLFQAFEKRRAMTWASRAYIHIFDTEL